ncbi:uncharacterized protein EI90DRAFT_2995625 [Cantharellus anzutake]|uniref:uncharacterized protein n=1 Tax=Cantharellus anzutake TaxID=1750568 RepID=UPI00190312B7|nr:uncharacterized protein EI90DRAFT_2995625 [Cantharellus anzutake]KAF8332044.1 hypothetical protein EI90DRAFT_2995625 [Cantharellus anzutake]
MSLRFLTGDENGLIKSVRIPISDQPLPDGSACPVTLSQPPGDPTRNNAVDKLALRTVGPQKLLAVARNGGAASVSEVEGDGLRIIHEWKEPRMKSADSYIGLAITPSNRVYTCTTSGHIRRTSLPSPSSEASTSKALLPMRLCDLQISSDERYLAYGGDEVNLSIWDIEKALSGKSPSGSEAQGSNANEAPATRKRKKNTELFSAEVWRAKNLPNDFLSLRQPVHVASLAFLGDSSSESSSVSQHIITGDRYGSVQRYDTRASGRPVAKWPMFKSVRKVQRGCSEREILVSDSESNLFSIDSRTGKILRNFKQVSGAVTCIATVPFPIQVPAPQSSQSSPAIVQSYFSSVSLDRYLRLHSTKPGGPKDKNVVSHTGQTRARVFMKSTPTSVVWDEDLNSTKGGDAPTDDNVNNDDEDDEGDGDGGGESGSDGGLWEDLDVVAEDGEDSEDGVGTPPPRKRRL